MKLVIQKRVEIALRSLGKVEQKQITHALAALSLVKQEEFGRSAKIRRLHTSGEKLYVYRGNLRLRLILSVHNGTIIVEDVVDHDRLNKLPLNRVQP